MKRLFPLGVLVGAVIGYYAGHGDGPGGMAGSAFAAQQTGGAQQGQTVQTGVMPFGFNRPGSPPLAPDATKPLYWSVDDTRKVHSDWADRVAKGQPTGGQDLVRVRTRTHSMTLFYRAHHDKPIPSLTKVMSTWDDAEQHAGVYDFYIIVGGTGSMIVGGEIENRQNLADASGPVPGEYRGQPIKGGQTFKVKPGDWLLIPPDSPHQPQPDAGGITYLLMKINVGMYPWNLIR